MLTAAEWLDGIMASVWREGLPCVAHQNLATTTKPLVVRAREAAEEDLHKLRRRCYRGLMAQGDDLMRYADAGADSETGDDESTVSGSSRGSRGSTSASKKSSRSARTARTVKSPREKASLDDLLPELATRSYKDLCRIALEEGAVEGISARAWEAYLSWMDTQPEGSKADVQGVLEAMEPYDWVTHSRSSQGGLTDVTSCREQSALQWVTCSDRWRRMHITLAGLSTF